MQVNSPSGSLNLIGFVFNVTRPSSFLMGKNLQKLRGKCVRKEVSQYPLGISFDQGQLRYIKND